ncbi:MAG: glycosyltransferase family 2 protein [Patescibacteria group bacterium]|jgi:GT2 family glycosyltransferase
MNKTYLGFITYGQSTAKYLPYFLLSLKEQTCFSDLNILAVDNSGTQENENLKFIRENYLDIKLGWAGKNLGFAKAYNLMISKAIAGGAKYFIAVNPDMVFEPDFAEKIVQSIDSDKKIGAVQPKILKWDFENNKKTDLVDSYGMFITKEHRFSDLKQGEKDDPAVKQAREIFGFTGAAVLFRLEALKDTAFFNGQYSEYFDELMFMYKEDCDLSYRLHLAGWKIVFAPEAVAYHDRSVSPIGESALKIALNRKNKSQQVKKWSFLNHWILLAKVRNLPFSLRVVLATASYQAKALFYVLIFEPYLLREFLKFLELKNEIKKRREALKIRINITEIEKFME